MFIFLSFLCLLLVLIAEDTNSLRKLFIPSTTIPNGSTGINPTTASF